MVSNFENLTNHSILSSSWLVLVSSDTNVITIGPNNTLIATGPGTATITASYLGQTASQTVVVAPAALQIKMNGTNAVIFWPSNSVTLQSSFDIGASNAWSPVTFPIVSAGGTNSLTVYLTNSVEYFRLLY